MISADLLSALREKDPEIHSRYVNLMLDCIKRHQKAASLMEGQ